MSIDIAWETFTAGADGNALSEKIRAFMHERFQQITLPRFINSVQVHSFQFGSVAPEIEIKDVCDPLPDFYEDDTSTDDGDDGLTSPHGDHLNLPSPPPGERLTIPCAEERNFQRTDALSLDTSSRRARPTRQDRLLSIVTQSTGFTRSGTTGIPGGTSNLSYFHMPVGGFSAAQTPLAAVASGTPFSPGSWHHDSHDTANRRSAADPTDSESARPRTAGSISSPELGSPFDPSSPRTRPAGWPAAEKVSDDLTLDSISISPTMKEREASPTDLQVVARVSYDGDVRMTLTAEILLDYPMPSFVGIPVKLSVTGMRFDGVAILAYIKKHMHFCFLDPDDAETLVGDQVSHPNAAGEGATSGKNVDLGSLLREIHVQSEIGRQESGKQVLKNVGKVEKFVIEQVKKIFEEEFVFPSFWTFLV